MWLSGIAPHVCSLLKEPSVWKNRCLNSNIIANSTYGTSVVECSLTDDSHVRQAQLLHGLTQWQASALVAKEYGIHCESVD